MISLMQGNCLKLMKQIPDGSIDMILCDPPYGATKCDWDEIIDMNEMWKQFNRVIKSNGAMVVFGSGMFTADMMHANRKFWRYNLIWEKTSPTGFLNAHRMPMRAHEDIMVFYKRLPTYNPQKTAGHQRKVSTAEHKRNSKATEDYGKYQPVSYDSTERFPRSVIKFKTDKQKSAMHSTQKPVELFKWIIRTYTNEGDTVLDPTMGSGTSGVACLETGRSFIGMEKSTKIFEGAKSRLKGGDSIGREDVYPERGCPDASLL